MGLPNTTTEALKALPLFSGLSKGDLKKVERLMSSINVKAGKALIKEGSPGREAFFIIEGTATVRRGNRVVAQVGPGDFLGEMSVLSGLPSVASVTADTPMTLEVLNRREFGSLLDEVPSLMKKILVGAMERLHELDAGVAS